MSKRKTTEQFIKEAIIKHGDKYDYSKVDYKNCDTNVIIICHEHYDFEQTPYSHLKGAGCSRCRGHKKTTEQFIQEATQIHRDKYDYSKVNYINSTTKIVIICKTHGEIEQMPSSHLSGQGCYKCGNNTLKTREEFIKDAKNTFGDKYDYSKVDYKGAHKKVIITCSEHGDFEMKPNCHLTNQGCYKCGRKQISIKLSSTKDEFIQKSKEIFGDKYDYSKVDYNGNKTKVCIICKIHGEFLQKPNGHLDGNGCNSCAIILNADRNRKTLEQFKKEAIIKHGDKYDYSKVDYKNCDTNVIIICQEHSNFEQTPYSHLKGSGCPHCMKKTEGKLYEKLLPLYSTLTSQFKQEWCKNNTSNRFLPFDFCIPEHKIIIELDGPQHFRQISNWSTPEEQFKNDKYKEQCANDNNYSVIRLLQEDVFNDTYDWLKELCETIEETKNGSDIVNIYLCKNNEYDVY